MSDIDAMSDDESHLLQEDESEIFNKKSSATVPLKTSTYFPHSEEYGSTNFQNKHSYNDNDGENDEEEREYGNEDEEEEDDDFNEDEDEDDDENISQSLGDESSFGNDGDFMDSKGFQSDESKPDFSKNEQLKMIYLRSFIKKVEKNFEEKDMVTQNIRQEIGGCKERLENLEKRRDDIFNCLQNAQDKNDITLINRYDSEHENLCKEIELETKVLEKLNETFNKADYERSKALLEKTKYSVADSDLKKKEELLQRQKNTKALARQILEDKKVITMRMKLEQTKELENERIRVESLKQKEAIEKAKYARQVTAQYLQKTLREMKDKQNNDENQFANQSEAKRKDLINLKHTIDHNKEIFQAKVNKKKFEDEKKKQALIDETNEIVARGENPNFFIPRKIKLEEYEQMKKKFEQDQINNTQEIVKKILKENMNLEKKKKLYPNLFNIQKPLKPINKDKDKKDLKSLARLASTLGLSGETSNLFKKNEERENQDEDNYERRSVVDSTTIASQNEDEESDFDELNNQDENLVKPEFEGLWNKKGKKYDSNDLYTKSHKFPTCFKTKAEKELYLKSLDKLKISAIREQVVAGRKFKGVSFRSQPRIIHFKDFDVGKTYEKTIVLTNISYTINTCKFIDITEMLKDFITVSFEPPGQLSAGLTCEFKVKFEPKINKDLNGEVKFLSTNGAFSIPISCTVKKCDLSVNTNSIYFGTIVIGETINRKLQLANKGALGTNFKIITLKEFKKEIENVKPIKELTSDSGGLVVSELKESLLDVGTTNSVEILNSESSFVIDDNEIIKIGAVKDGFMEPFSTIDLDFVFSPSFPGKFDQEFVIKFDDENSKEIYVNAKAVAIDVPIWIENINIDLKICMYDRLFQEVIKVHNRASAALRITFEIPSELKNHLEILPKTAFIQAKSEFSAQVKFIARSSLIQDAGHNYFDSETGVLEVPLFIKVADQNKVVNYSLHAIVTTSDLEFDTTEIDFGYCTIYETVKATVNLTNKSILCQPFGFVKLHDYVNVQPNDGFGTLLPNETIPIDINFCPKTAKEFKFTVLCKSLVNRDFIINCRGIGVHPPLKLSAQRINFKATALNSYVTKTIYICNDHIDYDQHRHPVPRIGNGEIATVGPTFFEFDLPKDSPFKLSPSVGCVLPGQKVKITVQYTVNIRENAVKSEAARLIKAKMIEKAKQFQASEQSLALSESADHSDTPAKGGKKKNEKQSQSKLAKAETISSLSAHNPIDLNPKTPDIDSIERGTLDYNVGYNSYLNNFGGEVEHFQVPCFVSSATNDEALDSKIQKIPYSIHNTLYLDIVCPSIKPEMLILSDKDYSKIIDFGKISIGQKCIKKIKIKNISASVITLSSNLLDPSGPFLLLNSLEKIEPGEAHTFIIGFIPIKNCIYQEIFEVRTEKSNLTFVLNAVGVEPSFSLSYEGHVMDFGYCLSNEKSEKVIEMKNNSNISIEFKVTLDSLNEKSRKENELKRYFNTTNTRFKPTIGPNNHTGTVSFDVFPLQGTIAAGSKMDLKITFSPDHNSELYADTMRISLVSNEQNSKSIQLFGKSRNKNMFIRGVEFLTTNLNHESMILNEIDPTLGEGELNEKESKDVKGDKGAGAGQPDLAIPIPILLTLYSISSSKTIGDYSQAEKIIHIGCMKSGSGGADKKDAKKNGDFTFENVKDINLKGFNIDLAKSAVEAGGERQIKVTWKPPVNVDTKQTSQASILLTTKGNSTETWKLILQGRIVPESYQVS